MTNEAALVELIHELKARRYHFRTVTPATHERALARPDPSTPDLRDIFGWNRPFVRDHLDPVLLQLLDNSGCIEQQEDQLRSKVRIASLGDDLFVHSSFPTDHPDSVFFGPDTYRFARFVAARLPSLNCAEWIVDMGAGSGAAAVVAARLVPSANVTLVDINRTALQMAKVNATAASVKVELLTSDQIPIGCDVVIANPPYMIDKAGRAYRDGGRSLGGELAFSWVGQALRSLVPGGTMLLYTGAAIVAGHARLLDRLEALCHRCSASLSIDEIDPDVFGEELDERPYRKVERIGLFGICITTYSRGESGASARTSS